MRCYLVTHDPGALFSMITKQQRDQSVVEANDTERRQTGKRHDARSVAAAGTKPQGSAADEHDSRESANVAGVTSEQSRWYDNNEYFMCGKPGHKEETEPAAPEASTPHDDDYVYIGVPRKKMVPVDNGLTETVQHQVSRSAGPHNAAPVLHAVSVQLPAPASQQSCGASSTISYARVSVLRPGGGGDTSVGTAATEPHLKPLTQHVAGSLAVSGASAAAEVKVLMDSGSGISTMSEQLVEALQEQPGLT